MSDQTVPILRQFWKERRTYIDFVQNLVQHHNWDRLDAIIAFVRRHYGQFLEALRHSNFYKSLGSREQIDILRQVSHAKLAALGALAYQAIMHVDTQRAFERLIFYGVPLVGMPILFGVLTYAFWNIIKVAWAKHDSIGNYLRVARRILELATF